MGSISSSMINNCPLAIPLLSQSKSNDLRGVTQDLPKAAGTEVAVWKTDWWCLCSAQWAQPVPKGEGQSPRGTATLNTPGILLAWLESRLTQWRWLTVTSGRLAGVGTWPEPHRHKGDAQGTFQLYSPRRAASQRAVMCPGLHKMKLGPLSMRT